MVQKKVVNKLGSQSEPPKSLVGNGTCAQHDHDTRTKGGGEVMKILKKSRSFKSSNFDGLRSPARREQSRFKKLSIDTFKAAAPLEKASLIRSAEGSPNYMKSTSSSKARRESFQSQVSSPQPQSSSVKSKSAKNSVLSKAASAGKVALKVLKRSSSLKTARPSVKKSCGMALYPKVDAGRATCSSTLKDSKFLPYVELHPGGTDSDGISVVKVCPYDYCSLNGCHRNASPPLKHFLSARQRSIKTQKSMKLKLSPSPWRKTIGVTKTEIDIEQMAMEKDPVTLKLDSETSPGPEVYFHTDFFVEIFSKPTGKMDNSENYSGTEGDLNEEELRKLDLSQTLEVLDKASAYRDETPPPAPSEGTQLLVEEEKEDDGVTDSMLSEPNSTFSTENDLLSNFFIEEIDIPATFPEKSEFELVEVGECWIESDHAEAGYECCLDHEMNKESETSIEKGIDTNEAISYGIATDCKEQEVPQLNCRSDNIVFSDDDSVSAIALLYENETPDVLACDQIDCVGAYEEVFKEVAIPQVYEKDADSVMTSSVGGDFESNDVKLDGGEDSAISPVLETEEESETPSGVKHVIIYGTGFTEFSLTNIKDITEPGAEQATHPVGDDDFLSKQDQLGDGSDGEFDQTICNTEMGSSCQHPDTDLDCSEVNELDDSGGLNGQTSESVNSEMAFSVTTIKCSQEVLTSFDVGEQEEKREDEDSNTSHKIEIHQDSEVDQGAPDADYTMTVIEIHKCDDDPNLEDRAAQGVLVNESIIVPNQSNPLATQSTCNVQMNAHIDNRVSEKDQSKIANLQRIEPTYSEECEIEENCRFTSDDCTTAGLEMQFDDKFMMGSEEIYIQPNTEGREKVLVSKYTRTRSNKPQPQTCGDLNWKINQVSKQPIENCELKMFNPRPPNFLDPESDPENEKVDLRHQMMDERKNAEEWMIDFALQQTVSKLATARKRKVAMLVEAFETVTPLPKCEVHLQHSAASFTHGRPMQACG